MKIKHRGDRGWTGGCRGERSDVQQRPGAAAAFEPAAQRQRRRENLHGVRSQQACKGRRLSQKLLPPPPPPHRTHAPEKGCFCFHRLSATSFMSIDVPITL